MMADIGMTVTMLFVFWLAQKGLGWALERANRRSMVDPCGLGMD